MKQQQNARARSADLIQKWDKEKLPLNLILDEDLQNHPFEKLADQQLCRALVYGVVRWRGYLDEIIRQYSKHPIGKMDADAKEVLRIALYQMLFMDRIPVSAAINEAVEILKKKRRPRWLTGFVNGLLRNVDRESEELPTPGGDRGYAPHTLHSYPKWLYDRWESRYGVNQAVSICKAGNNPAPLCLRAKDQESLIDALNESGKKAIKGQYSPQAVILPEYRGSVENLPGFAEGAFQVQDEAAQLTSLLLDAKNPVRCLDGCAGLGGKTTHLAEILPLGSTITAVEPDLRRGQLLQENLDRLGLSSMVDVAGCRLQDFNKSEDGFDVILLDAPCSGLGVIRHHPDIRWNREPEDLARYQNNQIDLLFYAAQLLKPAGVIIYATCSTEPEENEDVIDAFLDDHSDYRVDDCLDVLPAKARELVDERGFFHPLPDQGLDGFFAARLQKINAETLRRKEP